MPVRRWPAGAPGGQGGRFAPGDASFAPGLRLTEAEQVAAAKTWERIKAWTPPPLSKPSLAVEATRGNVAWHLNDVSHWSVDAEYRGKTKDELYKQAARLAKQASLLPSSDPREREVLVAQAQAHYDGYRQLGGARPSPLRAVALREHFDSLGLGELHARQSADWLDSSSSPGAMGLHSTLDAAGVRGSYSRGDRGRLDVSRFPSADDVRAAGVAALSKKEASQPPHLLLADAYDAVRSAATPGVPDEERALRLARANAFFEEYRRDGGAEPHPADLIRERVTLMQRYVRELYAVNQAALRDSGVPATVILHRGVHQQPEADGVRLREGERALIDARPASSWSTDEAAARKFARRGAEHDMAPRGEVGYVASASVPRERIYASHHLFADVSGEKEWVVLGAEDLPVTVTYATVE